LILEFVSVEGGVVCCITSGVGILKIVYVDGFGILGGLLPNLLVGRGIGFLL